MPALSWLKHCLQIESNSTDPCRVWRNAGCLTGRKRQQTTRHVIHSLNHDEKLLSGSLNDTFDL